MRRILPLFLAIAMLAALAVPAAAETLSHPALVFQDGDTSISGAVFEIWRVGEAKTDGTLVLTGKFAAYPVKPGSLGEDSSAEAAALYAYAKKDGITPDTTATTNANGVAAARNLASGLYLFAGQSVVSGGYRYHTEPQLLLLPQTDPTTGAVLEAPVLKVKFTKEPYSPDLISRKVLKIWDDHSGYNRPASVTVHLLKNGAVHSTVTLTAQNQWRHTWNDLDPAALWQITEEVPEGYTVKVDQEGNTFLLTNSAPEGTPPATTAPATPPASGTKIPQTGTLWWPIAVLAGLGLLFTAAGWLLRKKRLLLPGIVLLLAAAALVGSNAAKERSAGEVSREVLTRLELPESPTAPFHQTTLPEVPDWQRNPHMEMPQQIIDGTSYIGTLEIPVLELDLPIVSTTTGENLQKAPCRYRGSAYRDDLVLGAHNYDAHFGRLKKLSYDDEIRVTDLDGNVFFYRVADIEILQPDQLEDLLGGGWPLTLYTCTPGGQSRVTVRCERA